MFVKRKDGGKCKSATDVHICTKQFLGKDLL